MKPPGPIALLAAERAEANIGVREDGNSNSGKFVDQYLEASGVEPGNPWCLAFLYFRLWDAAGRPVNHKLPLNFPRSAYTPDAVAWAKAHGLWIPQQEHTCKRGDLALFYRSSMGRVCHVGIVTSVSDQKVNFHTVEGNTNEDGGREGYMVAKKTRVWSNLGEHGGFARLCF